MRYLTVRRYPHGSASRSRRLGTPDGTRCVACYGMTRLRGGSHRTSHRRSASARTTRASAKRRWASSLSPSRAGLFGRRRRSCSSGRALVGEHVERVLRAVLDGHEHLEHELVAAAADRRRGRPSHWAPSSSRCRSDLVGLLAVVLGGGRPASLVVDPQQKVAYSTTTPYGDTQPIVAHRELHHGIRNHRT